MDLNKYLERFYIFAGTINNMPKLNDSDDTLVTMVNQVLKTYIPDSVQKYYHETLTYVSVMELMISMLKQKEWVNHKQVLDDLLSITKLLISRDTLKASFPEEFNGLEAIPTNSSLDIATFDYSNNRYSSYSELINTYLEAYLRLIAAFYQKLDERALELPSLSLNDINNYELKEKYNIFFELHNYLIKRLKALGMLDENNIKAYIEDLDINIDIMCIIAGVLTDENNLKNYTAINEIAEKYPNVYITLDYDLRNWLKALQNKHSDNIVRG